MISFRRSSFIVFLCLSRHSSIELWGSQALSDLIEHLNSNSFIPILTSLRLGTLPLRLRAGLVVPPRKEIVHDVVEAMPRWYLGSVGLDQTGCFGRCGRDAGHTSHTTGHGHVVVVIEVFLVFLVESVQGFNLLESVVEESVTLCPSDCGG